MSTRRIEAQTLVAQAILTLRSELVPALPAEQRYAAAMLVNALEIARREILSDGENPLWQLLDTLYDDGEGSPKQLATDIRSGTVSETVLPGLGEKLRAIVRSELAVRNPTFLASRPA